MAAIVIAATVVAAMAVSVSADKTASFSGIPLGLRSMSGRLDGTLSGGYAYTNCSGSVYYISASVSGNITGLRTDGTTQIVDLGQRTTVNYNTTGAFASNGDSEPTGVITGSFWSAHEIRDGQNGVGRYLSTINV